jgi:ketosteroid isomerase-like protein
MTADDNKKLMQEIFAGLSAGDSKLYREHMAPDYRFIVMGKSSWSRTVHGEELAEYFRHVRSLFQAAGRTIPERFIAEDDIVVVEGRGDNDATSGARYDNYYCLVFRLHDDMMVECREYMDTAFTEQVFGPHPTPGVVALG